MSAIDAAEADVFDLDELVDAEMRALTAEARMLDAAERGPLEGEDAGIHRNDAVFQRLADAPDPGVISREEVGGEPELGVVRNAYCFRFGLEAKYRRQRPEGGSGRRDGGSIRVKRSGPMADVRTDCGQNPMDEVG